jgi:hypothetical protein
MTQKISCKPQAEEAEEPGEKIIRHGLRFWEYLGLANPQILKPKIWVPHTLVNCGQVQYWVWTDPVSGRIKVNTDANYPEFEKYLLEVIDQDAEQEYMKTAAPKEQDAAKQRKIKELIDRERKSKYFFIYRKFESDDNAEVVILGPEVRT